MNSGGPWVKLSYNINSINFTHRHIFAAMLSIIKSVGPGLSHDLYIPTIHIKVWIGKYVCLKPLTFLLRTLIWHAKLEFIKFFTKNFNKSKIILPQISIINFPKMLKCQTWTKEKYFQTLKRFTRSVIL